MLRHFLLVIYLLIRTFTGFRTSGESFPDTFPSNGFDYLRINQAAVIFNYFVQFNSPQCNNGFNSVSIFGLDNPNFNQFSMPVISFQNMPDPLDIIIDLFNNQIIINFMGDILYEGPLDIFFIDPPSGFCFDLELCRTIQKKSDLSDKTIFVIPPARSWNFDLSDFDPGCDTLGVFNNNNMLADWQAIVSGDGLISAIVNRYRNN